MLVVSCNLPWGAACHAAEWRHRGCMSDLQLCGVQIDVFDSEGAQMVQLSSEHQTAISSRHCVHPTLSVLAAGTASGRMHIYR